MNLWQVGTLKKFPFIEYRNETEEPMSILSRPGTSKEILKKNRKIKKKAGNESGGNFYSVWKYIFYYE